MVNYTYTGQESDDDKKDTYQEEMGKLQDEPYGGDFVEATVNEEEETQNQLLNSQDELQALRNQDTAGMGFWELFALDTRIKYLEGKIRRGLWWYVYKGFDQSFIDDNTHITIRANEYGSSGNRLDGSVTLSFLGATIGSWNAQTFCDEENINKFAFRFTLGNGSGLAKARFGDPNNVFKYDYAIVLSDFGHLIHTGGFGYNGGGSYGCTIMDEASMGSLVNSLQTMGFLDGSKIGYTITGSETSFTRERTNQVLENLGTWKRIY